MNIAILNWKKGENNPFDFFSAQLATQLKAQGCHVTAITLDEDDVEHVLITAAQPFHLALTWQGLYSSARFDASSAPIWEDLRLPLVCMHSDHPCHMPANHATDSPFVTHVYEAPSFAHYANAHFTRKRPALYFPFPIIFKRTAQPPQRAGQFFILPKNLDDTLTTQQLWRECQPRPVADFLLDTASRIQAACLAGDTQLHHDIIENALSDGSLALLQPFYPELTTPELQHLLHHILDKFYRNTISEQVVHQLHDVPLVIHGRGWDRFKAKASPHHRYESFGQVADGGFQYRSEYGIVDVCAAGDFLHDRTRRALAMESGFLSSSRLDFSTLLGQGFEDLFYTPSPGQLRGLTDAVMSQPERHRERCMAFRTAYETHWSFSNFHHFLSRIALDASTESPVDDLTPSSSSTWFEKISRKLRRH